VVDKSKHVQAQTMDSSSAKMDRDLGRVQFTGDEQPYKLKLKPSMGLSSTVTTPIRLERPLSVVSANREVEIYIAYDVLLAAGAILTLT
jgi:hypothetical protein